MCNIFAAFVTVSNVQIVTNKMCGTDVITTNCSIKNNVSIQSHDIKHGVMQLAVGVASFHETAAGLELQLPSMKNLWNTKHGARCCARIWKNYWRHQRKQRRWTSVVALFLKYCIACSICLFVCLCLLKYCRGEVRVMSICRLVFLFTLFLLYNNNYNFYYY